jgi:uncharacterized protein DUF3592
MNLPLVTSVIVGLVVLFVIVLIILSRRRSRSGRQIQATITRVQVEAGSLSSWWVVTAQWSDPRTGQIATFRSHHLKLPPKQHPGESITVFIDPYDPTRYRMEL